MNSILQSRLVPITSESSIDNLQRNNVVNVLRPDASTSTYRVYIDTQRAEVPGERIARFYMHSILRPTAVILWSTARQWLHPKPDSSGIMIANDCAYDKREILVPGDREYDELRADLDNLGLMR